jgi:hypothetical protein
MQQAASCRSRRDLPTPPAPVDGEGLTFGQEAVSKQVVIFAHAGGGDVLGGADGERLGIGAMHDLAEEIVGFGEQVI